MRQRHRRDDVQLMTHPFFIILGLLLAYELIKTLVDEVL